MILRMVLVVVFFLCGGFPAGATSIIRLSFEELVLQADLVALVECTTSGGITARYRCLKVYAGPVAVDDSLVIRTAPNQYGPVFPETFAGECFLVTAWKRGNRTPTHITSTSFAGVNSPPPTFPGFDYGLPLFQGKYPLVRQGSDTWEFAGSGIRSEDGLTFARAEADIQRLRGRPPSGAANRNDLLLLAIARRERGRVFGRGSDEDACRVSGGDLRWKRMLDRVARHPSPGASEAVELTRGLLDLLADPKATGPRSMYLPQTLAEVRDARVLTAFMARMRGLPPEELPNHGYALLRHAGDPELRPLVVAAVAEGLVASSALPPLPTADSTDSGGDGTIPREKQEEGVRRFIGEILHPQPDMNLVNLLTSEGVPPEEARRKAPPQWMTGLYQVRWLDPDLRAEIASVAIGALPPALPEPRRLMVFGALACCPGETVGSEAAALVDRYFPLLVKNERGPRGEVDPSQVVECLGGLTDAHPARAVPFFLRLSELPADRLGLFWLDAFRRLVTTASSTVLEALAETKLPDFQVILAERVWQMVPVEGGSGSPVPASLAGMGEGPEWQTIHRGVRDRILGNLRTLAENGTGVAADEANLLLASQGEAPAVPRLLNVFRPLEQEGSIYSFRHEIVGIRAMIGLTNLASGRDPVDTGAWHDRKRRSELKTRWTAWWEKHGAQISAADLTMAFVTKIVLRLRPRDGADFLPPSPKTASSSLRAPDEATASPGPVLPAPAEKP